MNLRAAFDQLKALLEAAPAVTTHSLPVLDGLQAEMAVESMAEVYDGTFADNAFTVVIMHPGAATVEAVGEANFFSDAFHAYVVENPRQREDTALDPVQLPRDIAAAVIGQPNARGGRNWRPAEQFHTYRGEARGFLFHRFTFQILTDLPALNRPAGPVLKAIP
jgi:hypothetical protein